MVTQEQLLKNSHEVAINALKNFFTNLGYNEEAFNHIYNIKLFIEPIALPNVDAEYRHKESIKEDPNDNIIIVNSKALNKYINMINTKKANQDRIVLNLATILVHEMIHANRVILLDYVEKKSKYKNDKLPNINEKPKEKWNAKSNLISEFYLRTDKLDEEKESDRIYYQGDFEEVITETLATMIIKTRKENKFDLDEVNYELQNSTADDEVKIGSKILTIMGIDTIKWFMTSAYDNNYYDEFEQTFKDRYEDLLYDISDIHTSVFCGDKINSFSVKEANEIIKEKTSKKR